MGRQRRLEELFSLAPGKSHSNCGVHERRKRNARKRTNHARGDGGRASGVFVGLAHPVSLLRCLTGRAQTLCAPWRNIAITRFDP
jgi:hypothetical protein